MTGKEIQDQLNNSSQIDVIDGAVQPENSLLNIRPSAEISLDIIDNLQQMIFDASSTLARQGEQVKEQQQKVKEQQKQVSKMEETVDKTNGLVVFGFYVLIAAVIGILISAVFFEVQTINGNNQQIMLLLQQIRDQKK